VKIKKYSKYSKKYFINFFIWTTAITCLVFLVFADYLKLAGYVFSILLIMLPFYLYSLSDRIKDSVSLNFIQLLQLFIGIATILNLLGSLAGYYDLSFSGYDKLVHFLNPILIFMGTSVLAFCFQRHFFGKSSKLFVISFNVIFIILGAFGWEFFESFIDSIFHGAQMFGKFGEVYWDTLYDLLFDFAGGLVASVLIYKRFYDYMIGNIKAIKF
jgi:hypothetical protein